MPADRKFLAAVADCYLINDLSALPEDEDLVVDHLLERLNHGQIYTWVGSVLLVLNPYNEISSQDDIYGPSEFDKYVDVSHVAHDELAPHIFAVAAKAHNNLIEKLGRDSQVIVVSGETGTGKTFNASKCLEFLNSTRISPMVLCQGDYTSSIMQRITDACRLVSVFTTASTERNEVSSRHGQLVRLHYDNGIISGAAINSFLLERSRVTKGSSNFQIFYQMIYGMSDAELTNFNLSRDEEYNILRTIDSNKKKYYETTFQDTLREFEVLNFTSDEKKCIFEVLALLIHMGNIQFEENEDCCTIDLNDNKSQEALQNTCYLSGLNVNSIMDLLTRILINPQSIWRKHEPYHRNLVTIDACRSRLHSIIRHLYDLLFQWILDRLNDSLSAKRFSSSEWLGILDIFGFESFRVNRMEQLCVNYANEKMQQYFMETYLENSRKDLQEEGFINQNQPLEMINLYKERVGVLEEGLFLTLNDASQSLIAIDVPTVMQSVCRSSGNKNRKFLREKKECLIIEHYSEPVSYSIKDLLSKNTDKVPSEISATFNMSEKKFLRSLININETHQFHTVKASAKRTMLAKLKYSMNTLIKELSKCDLHYVRCVKPCRSDNGGWDKENFRKQLACAGIFDALPLIKCKFPVRINYEDFFERYSKKHNRERPCNLEERCQAILEAITPKKYLPSKVHYGKRLIFLTESMFLKLEHSRSNYRAFCAKKIQSFWLKHRQKRIKPTSMYINTRAIGTNDSMYMNEVIEPGPEIEAQESCNSTDAAEDASTDRILSQENSDYTSEDVEIVCNSESEDSEEPKNSVKDSLPANRLHGLSKFTNTSLKLQRNFENYRKKCRDINCNVIPQLKDQFVIDCLTNITKRLSNSNAVQIPASCEDYSSRTVKTNRDKIDIAKNFILKEKNKQKYTLYYDKLRNLYTIQLDTYTLFYKNRILSKQRLTVIPGSNETRLSPRLLSRTEIPQGLQDCL